MRLVKQIPPFSPDPFIVSLIDIVIKPIHLYTSSHPHHPTIETETHFNNQQLFESVWYGMDGMVSMVWRQTAPSLRRYNLQTQDKGQQQQILVEILLNPLRWIDSERTNSDWYFIERGNNIQELIAVNVSVWNNSQLSSILCCTSCKKLSKITGQSDWELLIFKFIFSHSEPHSW